jgi:hypothetical protein
LTDVAVTDPSAAVVPTTRTDWPTVNARSELSTLFVTTVDADAFTVVVDPSSAEMTIVSPFTLDTVPPVKPPPFGRA